MNPTNRVLFQLLRNILRRNRRFKNLHKGESCYIFGNGVSLKDMDLRNFDDKISIGCNFLWLHNHFDALNVKYYCTVEPFWYFPFWRNRSTGKIELNPICTLEKRIQKQHTNINFFTAISNSLGIRGDNVYYVHHFDIKKPALDTFNLDGEFFFVGSLHVMVGMAIYMGFKSVHLVGCDYTHSPQRVLHFYEKGKGSTTFDDDFNGEFLRLAQERIDMTTITSSGSTSKTMKYIDYQEYTGSSPDYHENTELVPKEYLDIMTNWPGYSIY